MSDSPPPPMPSGWFPDPLGRHEHRYFNGITWTSDVADMGQRSVDPLGTAPGPGGNSRKNSASTAAVVMGSLSLASAWMPFVVIAGLILAVLAVIFGIKGLRAARVSGVGRGSAMAGTIMGGIGIALSVIGIILTVIVWNEVVDFIEPGRVSTEVTSCDADGRRMDVEGTLTNLDDEPHDYTLFVEVGGAIDFVVIENVQVDETVEWATVVTATAAGRPCEPDLTVNGPFPFGVEVDPVNR